MFVEMFDEMVSVVVIQRTKGEREKRKMEK